MVMLGRAERLFATLGFATLISTGFFIIRAISTQSDTYWFLLWNLWLAWLPLIFAWLLKRWLRRGRWLSWQGLLLSFLWLGFLPNSFYLVTDLIHVQLSDEASLMYDVAMLTSFALSGLTIGFVSIYLVHMQFLKRLSFRAVRWVIAVVLFLSSFAIYLGRELRWNTWDLLINPAGLLFDISYRLLQPASYPTAFSTTAAFFVLLASIYIIILQFVKILRVKPRS